MERLTEQKRKKQRGRVTAISNTNSVYSMRKSFSRGWSRYYKSDNDSDQAADASDKEGNNTNVRDFVALLPRTASLSLTNANKEEGSKQSLRIVRSEGSFITSGATELPDVVSGDQGISLLIFGRIFLLSSDELRDRKFILLCYATGVATLRLTNRLQLFLLEFTARRNILDVS